MSENPNVTISQSALNDLTIRRKEPINCKGCGREICNVADLYRCYDCSSAFHQNCLKEHCKIEIAALRCFANLAVNELQHYADENNWFCDKNHAHPDDDDWFGDDCEKGSYVYDGNAYERAASFLAKYAKLLTNS